MNILFLDDDEKRIDTFGKKIYPDFANIVTTASTAIQYLNSIPNWDFVFLDHDLGGEQLVDSNREDCGMEVVRWIVEHKPNIEQIIIHSWNSPAGKEMVAKLRDAGYNAEYKPFGLW